MKTALVLFISAMALSGCASGWQKDGSTEAEFYRDRGGCQMQANQAFPPLMVSSGGYQGPSQTMCRPAGYGQVSCTTTPGMSVPPVQSDQNALPRVSAFQDCMRGRGWVWGSKS